LKLAKAKEEGILIGQKQQREFREEELKRIEQQLTKYKLKCDRLEKIVKTLENDKSQLEIYNERADSEIKNLVEMLKSKQDNHKYLSRDTIDLKDYASSSFLTPNNP